MQFGIALALVALISTAVLLYQFWSGTLLEDEAPGAPADPLRLAGDDTPAPRAPAIRADHAA